MNKRVFISFPEQDSNLRDLLVGQSKNTNSPFDFIDMSVHNLGILHGKQIVEKKLNLAQD